MLITGEGEGETPQLLKIETFFMNIIYYFFLNQFFYCIVDVFSVNTKLLVFVKCHRECIQSVFVVIRNESPKILITKRVPFL